MISNMENEMGPHPLVVSSEFAVSGFIVLYIFLFVFVFCVLLLKWRSLKTKNDAIKSRWIFVEGEGKEGYECKWL